MTTATLATLPACDEPLAVQSADLAGKKFVWLLSPPWDDVWTRQNHFVTRLARLGAEVLYVENPSSWSSSWRQGVWREKKNGAGRVRELDRGLHRMKGPINLPGNRQSNAIAALNGRLAARQIAQWTRRQVWSDYSVWCRVPHSLYALNGLRPHVTVYDVTDDYELFETKPSLRRRVRLREDRLLNRADLVFFASKQLQSQRAPRNTENKWIPNGAEYDIFAPAAQPGPIHPLVAGLNKPVIGYVGLTTHWMDFELLEKLGRRWPGQIVMLGPIAPQVEKKAKAIPGLVWGGFVPQPQLAPYLRGFDLCIMPHVSNELVRMSNPLKIWEYLATGKPIVSTYVHALEPVRHLVDLAADHEEFLRLVEANVQSSGGRNVAAAQAAARARSWDALFEQMLNSLLPHLER